MEELLGKDDPIVKRLEQRYQKAKDAKVDQRSLEAQLQSARDRIQNHEEELEKCDKDIDSYGAQILELTKQVDAANEQRVKLREQLEAAKKAKDDVIGQLSTQTGARTGQDALQQCLRVFGLPIPTNVPPTLQTMFNDVQLMVLRVAEEVKKIESEAAQPAGGTATPVARAAEPDGDDPAVSTSVPTTPRVRKQPSRDEDDLMAGAGPGAPSKMRKGHTTSLQSIQGGEPDDENQVLAALAPRGQCS